jgi:glutamyl-Q tRNA(Asp) synthetase
VVDDADSGVTDVVRGCDLIDSTPWQIQLQAALRLPRLHYTHLPLVVNTDGSKLSKSAHAVRIEAERAASWLYRALQLLGQTPPAELLGAPSVRLWDWAVPHWRLNRLAGIGQLTP